jgi:membrane protease YdiL (CAAX protease family)
MEKKLEMKRIWIFILFAFGIAWAIDLAIYFTGGVADLRIWSLQGILLIGSMAAPTAAHILTRLVTGEGWQELYLRPKLKTSWRWWAVAWLGTPLLILLGAGLFFVVFPQYLDSTLSTARQLLDRTAASTGRPVPVGPAMLVVLQIVQGIVVAPLTNGWATLGEEFGWRAYLLHKLMPLGGRRAVLLLGVIWGVWHWPVIAMGYNYGLDYPGAPWLGMVAMIWFTVVTGTWLAWVTLKSRSVWPAVIGHAAINGLGAVGTLVSKGQPSPLLGPALVGLVVSLPFALLALWLLWRSPELGRRGVPTRQASSLTVPAHHTM